VPEESREGIVGTILRRMKFDELPQLFNVLAGDMSFVGPRPLLPVDMPRDDVSRLQVRPGITGWAQVSGGTLVNAEEKNALDQWYIAHASFMLDTWILLRTIAIIFQKEQRDEMAIAQALALVNAGSSKIDAETFQSKASDASDASGVRAEPPVQSAWTMGSNEQKSIWAPDDRAMLARPK
ncbi:MAG: sugar transferase, partial [Hyphomicrobiaceae bacterium]